MSPVGVGGVRGPVAKRPPLPLPRGVLLLPRRVSAWPGPALLCGGVSGCVRAPSCEFEGRF